MDKEAEEKMHQEHYAKYDALAQRIGIDTLKRAVPASADEIRAALEEDVYLNTIRLRRWDIAAGARFSAVGILDRLHFDPPFTPEVANGLSLAERVCVLKHVARHYIAEGKE